LRGSIVFDSDAPIRSCDEDELGRCQFARSISKAICQYRGSLCLVVGLIGSWGSGKTSIINMVCEALEDCEDEKLALVKFEPWLFSGRNDLLNKFFEELQSSLPKEEKDLKDKLSEYAKRILPDKISISFGNIKVDMPLKFIEKGKDNIKSIEKVKDDIDNLLKDKELKLVIFIDDIDRLTAEEIRQIFQLIRIVNLPNTVYLVSFDRETVVNALERIQERNGEEYLEKIIQVPFELPPLSPKEMQKIIQKELEKLLNKKIDLEIISPCFKTIRDIKRYINLLKFKSAAIGSETNEKDLAYITLLELFEPELFKKIYENKDSFTAHPEVDDQSSKKIEKAKEIHKRASNHSKRILKELFPLLRNWVYDYEELVKERRICTWEHFDAYFKLSLSTQALSKSDINRLIESTEGTESLKKVILKDPSLHLKFLKAHLDEVPAKNIKNIINTLLDLRIPSYRSRYEIIFESLKSLDDKDERCEVLKNAIYYESDIYLALDMLGSKIRHDFETLLGKKRLKDVQEILIQKLHKLFDKKTDKLFNHPHFMEIIILWNAIEPYGSEEHIKKIIKSDSNLQEFIKKTKGSKFDIKELIRLNKKEKGNLKKRLKKIKTDVDDNTKKQIEKILKQLKTEKQIKNKERTETLS